MKKILSVVLATIMLIVCLAPISSAETQSTSTENSASYYAEQYIETSDGATINDVTLEDGKVTFEVTLPKNGYAQFMQKLDVTSLKATVSIGSNSTTDYQNTDMYMQLTTLTDTSKDISPTGTDGLSWRFYGTSSSVVIGKNKATSNTYRSGLSNIVNDKGIIITFNKNDSGNIIPKAPENSGMTELPSDNTLSSINGNNGVYFRLRHDDDTDRDPVTYTVTLESTDIKSVDVYYAATDFIKYTDGATLVEDSVSVEDGTATFKITLPAGGYVQFMQKVAIETDLADSLTASVIIGNNEEADYQASMMQMQLTPSDDISKDITPVDEAGGADPGTDGITYIFYGSQNVLYKGRGKTPNGGGSYEPNIATILNKGKGVVIGFKKDADGKALLTAPIANGGTTSELASNKTLAQIGGNDGVYFRVRNGGTTEATYTVTLDSADIKKDVIKESGNRYENNFTPEIDKYIKTSAGATVDYDNSYYVDGVASIKVTLPAGGYVQFMEKAYITDDTSSSLNVAVKVNTNTTADYNTSNNTNFYMQLTPSSDIWTDIVPVNEKSGTDPGILGMTWRFYGANSYIAIGQGNNTNNSCGNVNDIVSAKKGINMAFIKDASDIVYPKALDRSDMTDQPSKKTLTDIFANNGVYFRLRSEVAQTYTIILKSPDFKKTTITKSGFIALSEGASLAEDSVSIEEGKATFKVTLQKGASAQFMQKLDAKSLKATVSIGGNTTTDYANTDMYMQLTTSKDATSDISPTGTDGLTWRFYGTNSSVVIGKNKATSNTYRSGLSNIVNDKGIIITFNEYAGDSDKIVPLAPKNSDMTQLPSDNTLSSINGNNGVYFRLRNDDDTDREPVTYTVTLESADISALYFAESDFIRYSDGAELDKDSVSIENGKATFKVTLQKGASAQFMQKLDAKSLKATVSIGGNTTTDYQNTDMYMQLTTSKDATSDISPTGTDGLTWRFYGTNSSVVIGKNKATSNTYRSGLSNIVNDKGIIITFNEYAGDSDKIVPLAPTNSGMTQLPSDNTLSSINGNNGVYFRLRNDDDTDREPVTYTVTLESPDIIAPETVEYHNVKYATNAIYDPSLLSVEDGKAVFRVTLPQKASAQFMQKLDAKSLKATVIIGNNTTTDYANTDMYMQLTTSKDATSDISPTGTDGLTWRFYGTASSVVIGKNKATSNTYRSGLSNIVNDKGIIITFSEYADDSDKIVPLAPTNSGMTQLPSDNTLSSINGNNGVYFRLRNDDDTNRNVTYTVILESPDIKNNMFNYVKVDTSSVEEDRYSFSDNKSYLISSSHNVENGIVTDKFTFKLNSKGSNIQLDKKISTLIDGGFAKVYLGDNTFADYAATNFNMQLTSKPNELLAEPVDEGNYQTDSRTVSFIFAINGSPTLSVNKGNAFGGCSTYIPNYANTPGVDGINVYFKTNSETGTIDISRVKPLNNYNFKKTSSHNVTDADLTDGAYFRLRHGGDSAQVYTVVLTYPESNVEHDLSTKAYTVTGASVVNANNAEEAYTTGNTITTPGHYIETSTVNGGTVTKNIYLYKKGDINVDNSTDILDLVTANSYQRYADLEDINALSIKAIDKFNNRDAFTKLRKELLDLDYDVTEYNDYIPVTLNVEDFGAVGDGVTDDAVAIYDAVQALRQCAPGSVLQFEAKTYRFVDNGTYSQLTGGFKPTQAVFNLEGNKGLTIKGKTEGDNTTLISIGGTKEYCKNYYANINNCEDVVIENIDFDYAEYKAAFAVTDVSYRDGWLQATINNTKNILTGYLVKDANGNYPDIHLEDDEVYKANSYATFGVLNKENSRYQMYFTSFKMVDKATGEIEITLNKDHDATMANLGENSFSSSISDFILPMPHSGNLIQRGFTVHNVNNFTMKDCKVYSASRHGMSLQNNTGKITFNNVDVGPAEDDTLKFASWGDFYHVLNSTGANYTWNDCEAKYNYDDVFNISGATLLLEEVSTLRNIKISEGENGFPKVYAGNTLVIVDSATGDLIYKDTIKRVVEQDDTSADIILSSSLPADTTIDNKYVWIEESSGISTMNNCTFDGTFRARANVTLNECNLTIKRFWIGLESADREGPLSGNVIFNKCSLTCQGEGVFEIGSHNKGTNATADTAYKLENIRFTGCTWNGSYGKDSAIVMHGNSADEVIHE